MNREGKVLNSGNLYVAGSCVQITKEGGSHNLSRGDALDLVEHLVEHFNLQGLSQEVIVSKPKQGCDSEGGVNSRERQLEEALSWCLYELDSWWRDQGDYGTGGYDKVLPKYRKLLEEER